MYIRPDTAVRIRRAHLLTLRLVPGVSVRDFGSFVQVLRHGLALSHRFHLLHSAGRLENHLWTCQPPLDTHT